VTHAASGEKSHKVRRGSPITRKVRVVCRTCNTGWLSDLEEELKPTLTKLIYGDSFSLSPWTQKRLATWAVKTAMTAEFLHPPTAAISFDLREHLRLHREPHPEFDVWIGCYRGSMMLLGMEHHSGEFVILAPGAKPTGIPNAQATIIGLGHLYLQIAYTPVEGARFDYHDKTSEVLPRIWPPKSDDLVWPPLPLDDEKVDLLVKGVHLAFKDTIVDL
jgi:hypothetical protein